MKKNLAFFLVSLFFILIFVVFGYTFLPVDCLAGCVGRKGIPLNYYEYHAGAFGSDTSSYNYFTLLFDLIFWVLIAYIIVSIIWFWRKKKLDKQK